MKQAKEKQTNENFLLDRVLQKYPELRPERHLFEDMRKFPKEKNVFMYTFLHSIDCALSVHNLNYLGIDTNQLTLDCVEDIWNHRADFKAGMKLFPWVFTCAKNYAKKKKKRAQGVKMLRFVCDSVRDDSADGDISYHYGRNDFSDKSQYEEGAYEPDFLSVQEDADAADKEEKAQKELLAALRKSFNSALETALGKHHDDQRLLYDLYNNRASQAEIAVAVGAASAGAVGVRRNQMLKTLRKNIRKNFVMPAKYADADVDVEKYIKAFENEIIFFRNQKPKKKQSK